MKAKWYSTKPNSI